MKMRCLARNALWHLVFSGFAVNYMIRINLNIAIVAMVTHTNDNNNQTSSQRSRVSECTETDSNISNNSSTQHIKQHNTTTTSSANLVETIRTTSHLKMTVINQPPPPPMSPTWNTDDDEATNSGKKRFPWDEKQQANVLGAFFWLHWCTQIPGGVLAAKYGTKLVFGLSNFLGVICCFAIPAAAQFGYNYLIAIRIIQGLIVGFAWPSMHNMTARWIPPNERSSFLSAYLGSSVGVALTYPLCGYLIDKWNWQLVFYVCGIIGSIWYIFWYILIYDSPMEHPRISQMEKDYIVNSLQGSYSQRKDPIPWRAIATSRPVMMNIMAQLGAVWGLFTLMTHAPTYFKFIHGWSITATGILSGVPHVLRMIWAYVLSRFVDFLLKSHRMSQTNVRKLATTFCTIIQGICTLILSFSNCDYKMAIILISLATATNGAVSSGPLASVVDISPNYASVILGVQNTIVAIVGFFTPLVVGYLTYENQTVEQWKKVFWIAAIMQIVPGVLYVFFSKSDLQDWNSPQRLIEHNSKGKNANVLPIITDTVNKKQREETIPMLHQSVKQ